MLPFAGAATTETEVGSTVPSESVSLDTTDTVTAVSSSVPAGSGLAFGGTFTASGTEVESLEVSLSPTLEPVIEAVLAIVVPEVPTFTDASRLRVALAPTTRVPTFQTPVAPS